MSPASFSEPVNLIGEKDEGADAINAILPVSTPSPMANLIPTMSPPLAIYLENPGNITACSDLTFLWNYSPTRTSLMTLFIVDWQQPIISNTTSLPTAFIPLEFRPLAINVSSDSLKYTWDLVDVKEGWYLVNITETVPMTGVSAQSAPFFVRRDPSITCLRYNSLSASHKPSAVVHHAVSHPLRSAELVGIVLGAVFGVCVLGIAFAFPRLWRRSLPSPKKRRPYILY